MSTNDWKMKLTAILTAILSIVGVVLHYLDPTQGIVLSQGITGLVTALGVFGLADKLQKLIKK